ncbi:tyrosine-type recombinase/integrase [Terrihalobacillus insolitus]|uniref:tyrosine-type recombinase/integrase n=1 Tax=Terrihalobacillus insolitus TaxID=2950438 RepID=UPI002341342C|nr:tyrosine-type recombinase/integrase [Terrihalobacillus insolitus]MDC3414308.1 site-specific integrase [Terrihalobacillus insolitus]
MNITYRKQNSKWEYRIRYKDPISHKYREKSRRGFRTKPEAKHEAEKLQRQLQDGYDQTNILLKDFLDFWLREYKEGKIRKNSFLSLKNSIDNHIKTYFKNIELQNLTPALYQEFINHLDKSTLARNSILRIHNCLYNALKRAHINKTITSNPSENAVIPTKERKDELKFIESSEVSTFLTHAYEYGYIYWIFFKVLIETGMRKGEAAALQWNDINFKELTISISKSLDFQSKNEDELFGETKTYHSKRTITISKSLANDLRFHANWQNQNKSIINDLYKHDLNLVLCRKDGNIMPKSSLFNAFERTLKRAGMRKLPIHSLRHTHAVLQLESGADMKYVQERLGHGSMQITSDVYSHVSKKMEQKNTAQFESYMDSILK